MIAVEDRRVLKRLMERAISRGFRISKSRHCGMSSNHRYQLTDWNYRTVLFGTQANVSLADIEKFLSCR